MDHPIWHSHPGEFYDLHTSQSNASSRVREEWPQGLRRDRFLLIGVSEFSEGQTVIKLTGAHPCFVGQGEGRFIDFKNTLILLTTNAGTDLIASLCKDPELMPDPEGMSKALRAPLLKIFPPALLGRLVAIPYFPLSDEMLGKIVKLQLNRIKKRVEAR